MYYVDIQVWYQLRKKEKEYINVFACVSVKISQEESLGNRSQANSIISHKHTILNMTPS